MRRIAFAWVVMAALAAGLAGLALGAQPGARARAAGLARAAPVPLVAKALHRAPLTHAAPAAPVTGGSTCFVGAPECSESPCVVFVRGAQPAVVIGPGVARVQPASGCPRGARRSGPRSGPAAVPSPVAVPEPVAVPALGSVLQSTAARLAHRLAQAAASSGP